MIRKILLLLVADARAPTFHRASVALRAYPAVEPPGRLWTARLRTDATG